MYIVVSLHGLVDMALSAQVFMDHSVSIVYGFITFFNNISVISWRSVLLMEENGIPG